MPDRKLGRIAPAIPPHIDSGVQHFAAMLAKPLKQAPPKVAWWKPTLPRIMGHNDKFGSCGPTSYANMIKVASTYTGDPIVLTADEVVAIYQEVNTDFNPVTDANDDGVVLTKLYDIMKAKGPRGTNLRSTFAVDPDNPNNMKWALRIFGPITFGVTLTKADMQASERGQPWSPLDRRSPVVGGHAVTIYDYDDDAQFWHAESWAAEQLIDYEWAHTNVDEVHGFIHPYQFYQTGLAFTGLDEGSMRIDAGLI